VTRLSSLCVKLDAPDGKQEGPDGRDVTRIRPGKFQCLFKAEGEGHTDLLNHCVDGTFTKPRRLLVMDDLARSHVERFQNTASLFLERRQLCSSLISSNEQLSLENVKKKDQLRDVILAPADGLRNHQLLL
jgi:hypothetical protein